MHDSLGYIELRDGWWYQLKVDGEKPTYNSDYINKYNNYPHVAEISELRYQLMRKHFPNSMSVLDVGYGNGAFLDCANAHGWETFGYDVSDYPLEWMHKSIIDLNNAAVDVTTFFDSLEHFETMNLQTILSHLDTQGIVISVPWCHRKEKGLNWFSEWKHRRPNEHFHHFNLQGMYIMLNEAGFKVLELSNQEDIIRTPYDPLLPNILTVVAKRKS